jgi:hypothetical protein
MSKVKREPPFVDYGDEISARQAFKFEGRTVTGRAITFGAVSRAFSYGRTTLYIQVYVGDTVDYEVNGELRVGKCTRVVGDRAWVMPFSEYWGPFQGPHRDRFAMMEDSFLAPAPSRKAKKPRPVRYHLLNKDFWPEGARS